MFRDLAKRHAIAAADLAAKAEDMLAGDSINRYVLADVLTLAGVHAQVSLACSAVAPPARLMGGAA